MVIFIRAFDICMRFIPMVYLNLNWQIGNVNEGQQFSLLISMPWKENKQTAMDCFISFWIHCFLFQSRFRIVTIDAGLLSFEDFQFNQSIYVVITNPKAIQFQTPREPFDRLRQSTHIRLFEKIYYWILIENLFSPI